MKKLLLISLISGIISLAFAEDCFDHGVDYVGNDLEDGVYVSTGSAEACQLNCQQTSGCNFWTWDPNYHSACWRKYAKGTTKYDPTLVSGPKYCGENTTPGPPDPNAIRIMSYNMFGWNALHNPEKTENMYKIIRAFNPDVLGAQEDEGMNNQIAENIGYGSDYSVAGGRSHGHSIIYRTSVLELIDSGYENLTPHENYGTRSVEYALFKHKETNKNIDFFNTHFCVCSVQMTTCCGQEAQFQSAVEVQALMESKRRPDSIVIFTGDLNVEDGFEQSKTILYLKGKLGGAYPPVVLEDTFRTANGESVDGTTYPGAGKIDYVFANPGTQVDSANIDRGNYGPASDHWPINAVIKV